MARPRKTFDREQARHGETESAQEQWLIFFPQAASIGRAMSIGNEPRRLLYGDWGTSKAYVIGLAFVAAGFSSLPIILAVCALTGLVGINYAVICAYFPDGGGVYSAARSQGRLLAVVGALLLIADLTVTAALSGWSGLTYVISGAEEFSG